MLKEKDVGVRLYIKVFLLAAAVAAVIFLPFVIYDRGLFLFYGDYNVQQIPFWQHCHEMVRSGNLGFDINTDLGVSFIGSYSFYLLGSPFFWLTLPFPSAWLPYMMAPLFVLKFAVSAVTSFMYIKRFVKCKNYAAVGALLYAFSGFSVYNVFFNHFNDVVAFFPLLLVALEEYIVNKRRGFFAVAVCLCATINYFFFVGQVVFVLGYFFVRCFTSKNWVFTFKEFLLLAMEAVLGVLMAAAILLPSFLVVIENSRVNSFLDGWYALLYPNVQRYFAIIHSFFFPPDIPARANFFPKADNNWASLGAWLPLFGMTGVLAFFKSKGKHFFKIMLGACFVMALVPGLNALFFLGNGAYYARWFYLPVLLMAAVTAVVLDSEAFDLKAGIRRTAIVIGSIGLVGIVPDKVDEKIEIGVVKYPERYIISMLVVIVSLILVYVLMSRARNGKHHRTAVILTTAFIAVVYSMVFITCGKTHSYESDYVIDDCIYGGEKIELSDDDFYRSDICDGMDNQLMFWRLPTIQAFHSIVPKSVTDFYEGIGIERGVATRPDQSFYALRTLTNVKYEFIKEDANSPYVVMGFEYRDTQNGYKIYENVNWVPMGYTYQYYATYDQLNNMYKTSRDVMMMQTIVLSDDQIKKYGHLFEQREEMDILSSFNAADLSQAAEGLTANGGGTSFKVTDDGFVSEVKMNKESLVVYSLPYEKGFTATVDGKPAKIENVNIGFMAVLVPEGEHTVEFKYETPGFKWGLIVSFGAFAIFLAYILISWRRGNLRAKEICNHDTEIDEFIAKQDPIVNLGFKDRTLADDDEDENKTTEENQ